ncbi:MAG: TlpA family protein disulfide reductase [Elusimicrobia bacterium]|nr:TlpA family protein disulfide reductase [Candidatus Liberimonas magnetica]
MKNIILILVLSILLFTVPAYAEKAPAFSLEKLNGKIFDAGKLIGKKTIVINFWASWCSSCREEIPELDALKTSPGSENAVFIGINLGESESKIKYFVNKNNYPYLVLKDAGNKTAKLFNLDGLPATIIIGRSGDIVYKGARPPKNYTFK